MQPAEVWTLFSVNSKLSMRSFVFHVPCWDPLLKYSWLRCCSSHVTLRFFSSSLWTWMVGLDHILTLWVILWTADSFHFRLLSYLVSACVCFWLLGKFHYVFFLTELLFLISLISFSVWFCFYVVSLSVLAATALAGVQLFGKGKMSLTPHQVDHFHHDGGFLLYQSLRAWSAFLFTVVQTYYVMEYLLFSCF